MKTGETVRTAVSGSQVRGRSQVLIWKTVAPVDVRIIPVASTGNLEEARLEPGRPARAQQSAPVIRKV